MTSLVSSRGAVDSPPFPSWIDPGVKGERQGAVNVSCAGRRKFFCTAASPGIDRMPAIPICFESSGPSLSTWSERGASMKIAIPYGNAIDTVELADRNIEQVIIPNSVESADEMETLRGAIFRPLKSPGLDAFLKDRKNILLVVNDATRPTPTGRVLEIIHPLLKGRNFKIVIATGSHRAPTEEEYDFIFGKLYGELKDRIHVHDAKKERVFLAGQDAARQRPDAQCTLVRQADAIIPIGSIEPHYFAGYTGGRKSFMPGVASYDCITANHRLAISGAAQAMVLKGNPVAEEFDDAQKLLEKLNIFAIMTVLDGEHRVYAAAAGDLKESFYSLLPKADEVFVVPIRQACGHRGDGCPGTQRHRSLPVAEGPGQRKDRLEGRRDHHPGLRVPQRDRLAGIHGSAELREELQGGHRRAGPGIQAGVRQAGKMAEIGVKARMWAVTPWTQP